MTVFGEKTGKLGARSLRRGIWGILILLALGWFGAIPQARAQRGNFRIGSLILDLKGLFEVEFNDNINYSNNNKQDDIILRPGLTVSSFFQISDTSSVSLDLGLSFQYYVFHPRLSSYSNFADVSPDSQLAVTFLIDKFTVKVYDSFSYSVQPSDAIAVDPNTGKLITNVNAYARFMNQIGINVDWDLNRVVLYVGAYRYDVFPQQGLFNYLRRWQYTLSAGGRYLATPNLTLGVGVNYTSNVYETGVENNSGSWFLGPTLAWQPMPNWSVSLSGGYVFYDFLIGGSNGDVSQPSTYTGELTITNKLSKKIDHTLTLTRSSSFGYVSNAITIDRVSYQISWQFQTKWTARFWAYYEWGADSGGLDAENYYKYGISPEIDWDVNKKTELYALFERTSKHSNFTDRSYDQNRLVFGIRYEF